MIDIKFLKENPEIVKQNIKNKFQDRKLPLVDEVIKLDAESRAVKQQADDLPDLPVVIRNENVFRSVFHRGNLPGVFC